MNVCLSLGSNRGEREVFLRRAFDRLRDHPRIDDIAVSGIYESAPLYLSDQPDFLNIAVECAANIEPFSLLKLVARIEKELGRKRVIRNGPRVIDIDILFFGDQVIRSPELEIPHPRMQERRFVLQPLAELCPKRKHPVLKKTVRQLLNELGTRQKVTRRGEIR